MNQMLWKDKSVIISIKPVFCLRKIYDPISYFGLFANFLFYIGVGCVFSKDDLSCSGINVVKELFFKRNIANKNLQKNYQNKPKS